MNIEKKTYVFRSFWDRDQAHKLLSEYLTRFVGGSTPQNYKPKVYNESVLSAAASQASGSASNNGAAGSNAHLIHAHSASIGSGTVLNTDESASTKSAPGSLSMEQNNPIISEYFPENSPGITGIPNHK